MLSDALARIQREVDAAMAGFLPVPDDALARIGAVDRRVRVAKKSGKEID